MSIDYEKLRSTAKKIVEIPAHYELEMEDNIPKHAEIERCFIWEDPRNHSNQIEISLDLVTGHLTYLTIGREKEGEVKDPLHLICTDEEARRVADTFVEKHAPDPAEYTSVIKKKRSDTIHFKFRQEVAISGEPIWGKKNYSL